MLSLTQSSHNANCLLLTYCGPPTWGRSDKARMHRKYWTGKPRAHRAPVCRSPMMPIVMAVANFSSADARANAAQPVDGLL
jgi:hypothetical protein